MTRTGMTRAGRIVIASVAAAVGLLLPAAASAHAYLVRTVPSASGTVNVAPRTVSLTFSEAVEPRFAIISVTDKDATSAVTGPVTRSASSATTLDVPLRSGLPQGWYLVYWRAISIDGHPVQGAFTFAIGPNPGPAPQFVIPHLTESSSDPALVAARWVVFLAVMASIGLLAMRLGIARPLARTGTSEVLRPLTVAFTASAFAALVAVPVFLEKATAIEAVRSFWDIGTLVPLWRSTAFGRGYFDLEICFGLFFLAGAIAIWVDRPERPQRSVVELLATTGVIAAGVAVIAIPGLSGHPAQTAPRAIAVALDWLHLASGSIWLGGLIGVIVLCFRLPASWRTAGLAVCVRRFSIVALVSVTVLLATGIWASVLHLPLLSALWTTSYGQAILVKAALLSSAVALAAVNILRTRPALAGASEEAGTASRMLTRLVSGEAVLIVGAVAAAAVLSSLAPPPPAFAAAKNALARVGPGVVSTRVATAGYGLEVRVAPNLAAAPNRFSVRITKNGRPVTGASVTLGFAMLDMVMGNQTYRLPERSPGVYAQPAAALVMVGHWGLTFTVSPPGAPSFTALVVDQAGG